MKATIQDAYALLHQGTLALSRMEHNGIRIDEAYLDNAIQQYEADIKDTEARMRSDKVFTVWKRRFGDKANINSRDQLAAVLFNELGIPYVGERTPTGKHKTDEGVLSQVDLPFVKDYLHLGNLRKDKATYLEGIRSELVEGYLHPSYNLNTVSTFRSSSDSPNFQNFPVRDPVRGKAIRMCFIPRRGNVLVEVDYSGIEVRISACYNHDPNLITYIQDPTTDMHRDTAAELFLIDKSQVEKKTTRDWAKNRFVFPQFYGSVFFQCAPNLWEAVKDRSAKLPDGTPILDHLKVKGIKGLGKVKGLKGVSIEGRIATEPGTFTEHVRKVEESFWEDRFGVYHQWKKEWYNLYRKRGWFDMKTGFRCVGVFSRNEVINYPVQGSAFHCLLQSIILLQRRIVNRGMRTKIIGQIHDSILADVPRGELQDYLSLAREIMVAEIPRRWPWIIIPLEVECEVAEENWHTKVKWEQKEGSWKPAK